MDTIKKHSSEGCFLLCPSKQRPGVDETWNIDPVNTYVGLGPALCRACSDFTNPETEAPELKKFFRMNNTIDLRDALDDELAGLGVPKKRIERLQDCTRCHPEQYWTYRGGDREAVQRGCTNCLVVTLRS
jgi:copper oxidase (laccase) domain-containing protein